jgi:hypothetical protein
MEINSPKFIPRACLKTIPKDLSEGWQSFCNF